jgi:hypothetical protein
MAKGKRNVYDPTIVSRLADEHNASSPSGSDDGEMYFTSDVDRTGGGGLNYVDGYMTETAADNERQLTSEILDPKLHDLHGRGRSSHASKARRRRCLLITTLMVTLAVVIAVICGVTVQKSRSASSSSKQQNLNQVEDGVSDKAVLPAVPANLKEMCTGAAEAANSLDNSVLAQCQAACEPAKCCEIPSQFKSSCLRGNEDECMAYHQECFVLELETYGSTENDPFVLHQSNVTVLDAPPELADTCAMNMLTSNAGVFACNKLCKPYSCCFSTGEASCANQQACAGYAPCLNMRAHKTLDSTIQKEVNALCQMKKLKTSVENREQCNNACKLARCCFNDGCFAKPDGFCAQYTSCKNLLGKKADAKLKDIDDATYDDEYDDDDNVYDGSDGA